MNKKQAVSDKKYAIDVNAFHHALISWGASNFRVFPWRTTSDPYKILMAEIMLHRTQAIQVVPVYEMFTSSYPTIDDLTGASPEAIHHALYPLGLKWRADFVIEMGCILTKEYDGCIPREKDKLLSLPGVSDYIASAVRCFAWDYPDPLIDTNTVRVIGRVFGLEIKDSSRRNRQFRSFIEQLVDPVNPSVYNYALLDLASLVCTKRLPPRCEECPVRLWCDYRRQNRPDVDVSYAPYT